MRVPMIIVGLIVMCLIIIEETLLKDDDKRFDYVKLIGWFGYTVMIYVSE